MTTASNIPDLDLTADCARCLGLCCTALRLQRADGFGHDKPAGSPCHFLGRDYTCAIHPRREALGYEGCIDFDCLGAGQRASKEFAGQNWQRDPAIAKELHARFGELLKLQEMKAALIEAKEMEIEEDVEQERIKVPRRLEQVSDLNGSISNQDVETALRQGRDVLKTIFL